MNPGAALGNDDGSSEPHVLQVHLEDAVEADRIFSVMGDIR